MNKVNEQERNSDGRFKKVYRYETRAEYEKELNRLEMVICNLQKEKFFVGSVNDKRISWLFSHLLWFARRKYMKLIVTGQI